MAVEASAECLWRVKLSEAFYLRARRWQAGVALIALLAVACAPETDGPVDPPASDAVAEVETQPEPVNGWIELALPDHVHAREDAAWRSDVIEIPVEGGGGALEYKLAMSEGDVIVYHIDYGDLAHPGDMVSEFHGHTEKNAEGIGDLMFYAKTSGVEQSGALTAPFDGIHGWYLQNDGARDVVVTLNVAGFYELIGTGE